MPLLIPALASTVGGELPAPAGQRTGDRRLPRTVMHVVPRQPGPRVHRACGRGRPGGGRRAGDVSRLRRRRPVRGRRARRRAACHVRAALQHRPVDGVDGDAGIRGGSIVERAVLRAAPRRHVRRPGAVAGPPRRAMAPGADGRLTGPAGATASAALPGIAVGGGLTGVLSRRATGFRPVHSRLGSPSGAPITSPPVTTLRSLRRRWRVRPTAKEN